MICEFLKLNQLQKINLSYGRPMMNRVEMNTDWVRFVYTLEEDPSKTKLSPNGFKL